MPIETNQKLVHIDCGADLDVDVVCVVRPNFSSILQTTGPTTLRTYESPKLQEIQKLNYWKLIEIYL